MRPFLGSQEFINGNARSCLWLGDASSTEFNVLFEIMKRIDDDSMPILHLVRLSEGGRRRSPVAKKQGSQVSQ